MTRSVYIVGGAGTGKSTFMDRLLDDYVHGDLEDLHALPNKKNVVTLRGHRLVQGSRTGLYLGCIRESFPGTDGLDRASSPVAADWLHNFDLPDFIIGEGATLATRRFLTALNETTDMLLVHLYADDFVKELRFLERGSNQHPSFITATATRSANLVADMAKSGVTVREVDSANIDQWREALAVCIAHLGNS